MGPARMANVLGRAGLVLGATTIRRMVREDAGAPEPDTDAVTKRRRRIVAKYPRHCCRIDLTAVPTRAGFWVPWFPFSLPQRWPFCWWVAAAIDQVSRVIAERRSDDELSRDPVGLIVIAGAVRAVTGSGWR